jgi:hypothetical protein
MKAYRRKRRIAPLILNLDIRWRLLDITPRPIYFRETTRYPLNRRLGKASLEVLKKGKYPLHLPGFEPRIVEAAA